MTTRLLGSKVRAQRRKRKLAQVELAKRLGISPSYLNLIEHNQRPLTAPLLIKLAQEFQLDLQDFAAEGDDRLTADLIEIFADPLFEGHSLTAADVRELVGTSPTVARAVVNLYHSYRGARTSVDSLATRIYDDQQVRGVPGSRLPSEEITDFIQRHQNHFPELEQAAEALWQRANLSSTTLARDLITHLERDHGTRVRIGRTPDEKQALRRYDPERRELVISEALPAHSRQFQLAAQIGVLTQREFFDRMSQSDQGLTSDESRTLCRVVLANYFAGAVSMPYQATLEAARTERYDIELIGHRFGARFEQVCHRLTTLRRPGAEGVPFHMIRVDLAGNISKRFSASGIHFARFSGACPRWNVFSSFLTPGLIRVQISVMPDSTAYFCMARTVPKGRGGYRAPHTMQAIGLGCELRYAPELVYSDGIDLDTLQGAVPVGVTCRLCERSDCAQRAFPSIRHPMAIDENIRGVSFYAPTTET